MTGRKKTTDGESTSAKVSDAKQKGLPWVEKYRPKTVDDIAYQNEVVAVLKKCLDGKEIPNLLFYGPPGTGKTSAILALAKEIFGHQGYRDRVLELNASDERGIQVIRDKVKSFAQFSASAFRPDGKPCPPLKLIILDEADSMTSAAQSALRRTMEKESKTTRFCLICNYISRIIEPLTSRCAKFRFKPLTTEIQILVLKDICQKENVGIDEQALIKLIEVSEGDLRRTITSLQSAAKFKLDQSINLDDVNELAGIIPVEHFERFLTACKKNRVELLEKCLASLQRQGFSAYQLMNQLHDYFVDPSGDVTLNDKFRSKVLDKLALCEYRLLGGADEFIQLMDLGCSIMMAHRQSG